MTTTPPKKSTASRRKRTNTPAATSSPEIAMFQPDVEAVVPETAQPAFTADDDTVISQTAEPAFKEMPPLVGEFISKEDWADTTPHTSIPHGHDIRSDQGEEQIIDRVKHLNRNMGWVLISAGLVGIVIPGVIGTPFVILGTLVLWPGNQKLLDKWRKDHRSRFVNAALRQVDRYLDDIERRYPSNGKTS